MLSGLDGVQLGMDGVHGPWSMSPIGLYFLYNWILLGYIYIIDTSI